MIELFYGKEVVWWIRIYHVLQVFNIKDAKELADKLQSCERTVVKEKLDD